MRKGERIMNNIYYPFIDEEINRTIFIDWVDDYGIKKQSSSMPMWVKLLGRKFQYIQEISSEEEIPNAVQQEIYETEWNSRVLVAHFYSEDYITNVDDFLYKRGLQAEWYSYEESWYNPGVSFTAVISIDDPEAYVNYIESNRKYDPRENYHWI